MGYFRIAVNVQRAGYIAAGINDALLRLVVEDRCLAKSDPNEPIFVLRARDITSPDVVQAWLDQAIVAGMDPRGLKALHTGDWIKTMRAWQRDNPDRVHVPD